MFLAEALGDRFVVRRLGAVGYLSLATGVLIPFGSLHLLFVLFRTTCDRASRCPNVRQVTASSVAARAGTDRYLSADLRGHGEHHAIIDAVMIVVCPLLVLLLTLPVVSLAV